METYLVGGAIRDELLGLAPGDRDWVVVGATPEQMLDAGFRPVGRDFPVFLHPHTGEEHALARTERKSGRGHRGFVVDADPSVTLEEDLQRRDFTINAIARTADGALVDPYGGAADIRARVLRHVGPAFAEDPLRVLRAARFMARLAPLGFQVAPETMALMRAMVAAGELETLVPERVWQELRKALAAPRPSAFLSALRGCGALAVVLPEVDALYGVPQRAEYHPEVDTGVHQELVSDMAAQLAPGDDLAGFAALTHDLGKALTPAHVLPRHIGHEGAGLKPLARLCERLRIPTAHVGARASAMHRLGKLRDGDPRAHKIAKNRQIQQARVATVLELLERCDAFRNPGQVQRIALCCEADKRGRLGSADADYPQGPELGRLHAAAAAVNARDLPGHQNLQGPQMGEAVRRARVAAIAAARTLRVRR